MTEETTQTRIDLKQFDSSVLIQRALLTNNLEVSFNNVQGRLDARHGALAGSPKQAGWWLSFTEGMNKTKVLQIPDQAVTVRLHGGDGDMIDYFHAEDIHGNPIEITLCHRPMTATEITMPYQEFIDSVNGYALGGFLKMYSDNYISRSRPSSPLLSTTEGLPAETVKVLKDWHRQGDESADFRVLRQMQVRGKSDAELIRYCKMRMQEILSKIVTHEPWFDPQEFRQLMETDAHNFDVMWKFLQSRTLEA